MPPIIAKIAAGVLVMSVHLAVAAPPWEATPPATGVPAPRWLIYYGWGIPDTRYVREHWEDMERMPFDGTGITVVIDRATAAVSTDNQLGWQVMGRRELSTADFHEAAGDLRAARWRRFHENFLPIALSAAGSAGGLTWFDDGRWHTIARNVGVVSWIAQEGGVKGLIFDPEHYGYPLFSYTEQRRRTGRTFEETQEAARKRGREIVRAVKQWMPRPVILSLFGHTLPLNEMRYGRTFQGAEYALLPAFLDGVLEAIGDEGTLVDGYEFAYGFKKRSQYLEGYRRIHHEAITLSSVREQYRKTVRAGFGIRLDHQDRLDYFTPQELQSSLQAALDVSDGYVWLYSQAAGFFPPSGVTGARLDAITQAWNSTRRRVTCASC